MDARQLRQGPERIERPDRGRVPERCRSEASSRGTSIGTTLGPSPRTRRYRAIASAPPSCEARRLQRRTLAPLAAREELLEPAGHGLLGDLDVAPGAQERRADLRQQGDEAREPRPSWRATRRGRTRSVKRKAATRGRSGVTERPPQSRVDLRGGVDDLGPDLDGPRQRPAREPVGRVAPPERSLEIADRAVEEPDQLFLRVRDPARRRAG